MSKLSELIARLCPDGVEYKALGEVCTYGKTRISSSEVDAHNYVGVDNLLAGCHGKTDSEYVPKTGNLIKFVEGDVLLGNIRPYLKKLWLSNQSGGTNGDVLVLSTIDRNLLLPEFLYQCLSSDMFFQFDMQHAKGAKMPRGDKAAIMQYKIPVPPLEVQREIVRILDNFAELTTELTEKLNAELIARQKQYEYYRDLLLNFDDAECPRGGDNDRRVAVRWMKLIDVCDYVDYRGKTPKKTEQGIFLVTAKNIRFGYIDYDSSKEYIDKENYEEVMRRGKPEIGDVLLTTEAPCGYVAQVDRSDIALAQRVIKYRGKSNLIDNSFLKYVLMSSQWQDKLQKNATGSTVKGIKGSKLHQLTVPVPPLSEQRRIVAILDRFDALCHDISAGLPVEIAARKKQYEYYRDKLLTFEEKTA